MDSPGAYRRPRELNWWFGMALLFLTLGFSLTGYLLPWDQKGYWATRVATNIAGNLPGAGRGSLHGGHSEKKEISVQPMSALRRLLRARGQNGLAHSGARTSRGRARARY